MADSISILGLATSLLLPWLCGTIWTLWLLRKSGHWNGFIVAGHGYLVGVLLVTLLIRLWSAAGLELQFWNLTIPLTCLMLLGLVALGRQSVPQNKATLARSRLPVMPSKNWRTAVIALLVGLILYRYTTLIHEFALRPLFPWDAWMNWAPKAIVWFYHNGLVPYVSPVEWSQHTEGKLSYTLGNFHAWRYPINVPLIQLWSMLGAKTSDHPLVYFPWIMIMLSLALALLGHLRLSGLSPLGAALACYILLNLPYINIHTVLTGYADLWLAAVFGLATFALHGWHCVRHWSYALLALFFALGCALTKIPGIVLGVIIVAVFLASLTKLNFKLLLITGGLLALCLTYTVITGIEFTIPNIGQFTLNQDIIDLPYIGSFSLEYHPVHGAFLDTLFYMQNWNMLWYLSIVAFFYIAWKKWLKPPSPELALLILGMLFIFFTFYFTIHYRSALNFTALNRALLYLIPVLIFYLAARVTELLQHPPTDFIKPRRNAGGRPTLYNWNES